MSALDRVSADTRSRRRKTVPRKIGTAGVNRKFARFATEHE
jgi:hypothetical protein